MNHIYVLDIGSSQDYAAGMLIFNHRKFQNYATFTGRMDKYVNKNVVHEKHLIYTWRPPLRTRYEDIVEDTYNLLHDPKLAGDCWLIVDRGNAGQAVIEMMISRGLAPIGITATNGNDVTESKQGAGWNVPKRDIVAALRVELEQNRILAVPGIDNEKQLQDEMRNFKITISKRTGHDSYEAFKEKDHDDMVMSLAMGMWFARRVWPQETLIQPEADKQEEYDPLNFGLGGVR